MVALVILLSVIAVSILATRIAARVLVLTGLSEEIARFQARSVFSGVGFTTDEAEHVVNQPVRRRVVLTLMLLGNAGLATAISTFVISFVGSGSAGETLERGLVLVAGLLVLTYLARSKRVDRVLARLIERGLNRFTDLEVVDYRTLLHLGEGFRISRVTVNDNSWLANKTLRELNLPDEGVLVLCIEADGARDCAPHGDDAVRPGDTLVLYGRRESLAELSERLADAAGERAHERAKRRHRRRMATKRTNAPTAE